MEEVSSHVTKLSREGQEPSDGKILFTLCHLDRQCNCSISFRSSEAM